jgi:hypothetical protein
MTSPSHRIALAALGAALFVLAGCGSQKEPAEQALAAIEKKFQESGAEIEKYLPERHAEVSASVAALRDAFAQEDFGDVVGKAASAQDAIKRAIAEARIRRAELRVEMESEWGELTQSMPAMIEAMDRKISSQRGRPPKGMAGDAWKSTIEAYDSARDSWTQAVSDVTTSAKFEDAVLAAREAKTKIGSIMESLGVKAS